MRVTVSVHEKVQFTRCRRAGFDTRFTSNLSRLSKYVFIELLLASSQTGFFRISASLFATGAPPRLALSWPLSKSSCAKRLPWEHMSAVS